MDSVSYIFTSPGDGCTDPTALNYTPLAMCPSACIYPSWDCDPITGTCFDPGDGSGPYPTQMSCNLQCQPPPPDGCTDPCAVNYDAGAINDDGSCLFKACLDPAASNFQFSCDCGIDIPTATINDQPCCIFPCSVPPTVTFTTTDATGTCTIPNSDGSITITQVNNSGASSYNFQIFDVNGILVFDYFVTNGIYFASGASGTYSLLPAGVYSFQTIDSLGCVYEDFFSIGINAPGTGCMDPLATNYDSTAVCDCGCCIYCGCTDPLALNYNPTAVCDDGSCLYPDPRNPCIPPKLNQAIVKLKACLAEKGTEWLYDYKIGTNVDCSTMDTWKLILLGYVLKADRSEQGFGLTCLFNCADKGTPNISTIITNCNDLWIQGGPKTGLFDIAQTGTSIITGEGTTISDASLFFITANKLLFGDIIKMPSGLYWKVISPITISMGLMNPETASGATSGNWAQCTSNDFINITTSVNYYDNFLKFVNKYCKDCNIPTAWQQ